MPNRPQDPPEGSYSLNMAPGVCRPTSPPPPRKKEPMSDLDAMRHNWIKAVEQASTMRKVNESLKKEVQHLRKQLGQYECPMCGVKDRDEYRYIHTESAEAICFECGGSWD